MAELTISLQHQPSDSQMFCGVCGASFIPVEDSGSRILGLKSGAQEFDFLLCGGCHSKWAHGAIMRIRSLPVNAASSSSPQAT
jgi:hypothetical protein